MKVFYSKLVYKKAERHKIPLEIWQDFRDAFEALSTHRNFRLFDIKKLVNKGVHAYYRMRIRNYRAIFRMGTEIYVEDIGPRGEIYK